MGYTGKYGKNRAFPLRALFLGLALAFGLLGLYRQERLKGEQALLEQLSEAVGTAPGAAAEEEPPRMLPGYAGLYQENPDLFGWLRIEGTRIDYPVMHSPEEPEKYLHRDFSGREAFAGTPFLDGRNTAESDQLLIYGHNMANGTMFHDLFQYGSREFWENHPTIRLS